MANAAALVVGIDKYDDPDIPVLNGNYPSAKRAVEWLAKHGVPSDRIFLHVSPAGKDADFPGVKQRPAGLDDIIRSMKALSKQSGDQLFIFLCGHGLSVQGEKGPIFLAQDYGAEEPNSFKNMRLHGAIYWALRWNFADQFLFYDACQNPSSSVGQISLVDAMDPTKLDALPPVPVGGMLACLSAALGQTAWAGDGDGVLVPHVLDALDADVLANLPDWAQQQDAILYDWSSGARRVDLRSLFMNNVAPQITTAAKKAGNIQTPRMLPAGLAETLKVSPVLDLQPESSTEVTIKIEPPSAVPAIRQISLRTAAATRKLNLPLEDGAIAPTSQWRGPSPNDLVANCGVVPGLGWSTVVPEQTVALDKTPLTVTFEIAMAPPADPPGPPDMINVRLNGPDGNPSASLGGEYDQIAAANDLSDRVKGVTFRHNEHGPDIGFTVADGGSAELAKAVANDWLMAIRRHVAARGESASLFPAGVNPDGRRPNLRFALPTGAAGLAGFLAESVFVTVTPTGDDTPEIVRSLADLERHPVEWVEPGASRVTVELPWGRWSELVAVEDRAEQIFTLPESIGLPPMRNAWANDPAAADPMSRQNSVLYRIDPLAVASLALLVGEGGSDDRVEPFSRTALPEWDMLFSAGRIDLVEEPRIRAIARALGSRRLREPLLPDHGRPSDGLGADLGPAERELLLLALGHAAHGQGWDAALRAALRSVGRRWRMTVDYQLLLSRVQGAHSADDESFLLAAAAYGDEQVRPVVLLRATAELLAERLRAIGKPPPDWSSRLSPASALAIRTRSDDDKAAAQEVSLSIARRLRAERFSEIFDDADLKRGPRLYDRREGRFGGYLAKPSWLEDDAAAEARDEDDEEGRQSYRESNI